MWRFMGECFAPPAASGRCFVEWFSDMPLECLSAPRLSLSAGGGDTGGGGCRRLAKCVVLTVTREHRGSTDVYISDSEGSKARDEMTLWLYNIVYFIPRIHIERYNDDDDHTIVRLWSDIAARRPNSSSETKKKLSWEYTFFTSSLIISLLTMVILMFLLVKGDRPLAL